MEENNEEREDIMRELSKLKEGNKVKEGSVVNLYTACQAVWTISRLQSLLKEKEEEGQIRELEDGKKKYATAIEKGYGEHTASLCRSYEINNSFRGDFSS